MQRSAEHQQQRASRRDPAAGHPAPAPVADLAARREARDGGARWEASAADAAGALLEAGHPPALPQAAPEESPSLLAVMYEAAVAEGERRVYARLGIPQPLPSSPARPRHLAAVPESEPEIELEAE